MKIPGRWMILLRKIAAIWENRQHHATTNSTTTIALTQYQVKAAWQERFMQVLSNYTTSSRQASGNIMAGAYYEHGDSCTMWTIERWFNKAFYAAHKKTAAAKTVSALAKIGLALPVKTIFIKDLELVARESDGTTAGEPVTIMLIIDVKPGNENYFKSINHDLMLSLQAEPRLLFFQFGQVVGHTSRFIIYKTFSNWQMFQHHLKDPALAPIMNFLQTSIKAPPFEKNYHHLISFTSR